MSETNTRSDLNSITASRGADNVNEPPTGGGIKEFIAQTTMLGEFSISSSATQVLCVNFFLNW